MSDIEISFELEDFEIEHVNDFRKKWTKKFKNEISKKLNHTQQQDVRTFYNK